MSEYTNKELVKRIEDSLSNITVLHIGFWRLKYNFNPRYFVAVNPHSKKFCMLGASKTDAAKYFNRILNNQPLPIHITMESSD